MEMENRLVNLIFWYVCYKEQYGIFFSLPIAPPSFQCNIIHENLVVLSHGVHLFCVLLCRAGREKAPPTKIGDAPIILAIGFKF